MIPSGFISTSSGFIGAMSASEALSLKGAVERPWKERDQSTWFPAASVGSAVGRVSSRPMERERWFEVAVMSFAVVEEVGSGVGFVGAEGLDAYTGFAGVGVGDAVDFGIGDAEVVAVLVVGRT